MSNATHSPPPQKEEQVSAYTDSLREQLAFAEQQERAAEQALSAKRFPTFYEPQFQIVGSKREGTFLGLSCKSCRRWADAGHASDCAVGELEKAK